MTAGLILTLWVGIGAIVYKPPDLGHTPPPMNIDECPYRNVTVNNTSTDVSTSPFQDLSSTISLGSEPRVEDKLVRKCPFYSRDAMLARYFAVTANMSVRPSFCLSQVGVLRKRLNVGSRKQHRTYDSTG